MALDDACPVWTCRLGLGMPSLPDGVAGTLQRCLPRQGPTGDALLLASESHPGDLAVAVDPACVLREGLAAWLGPILRSV